MANRRKFTSEFKKNVGLEALKGIPPANPILPNPKRKLTFEAKTIWTEEGTLDTVY